MFNNKYVYITGASSGIGLEIKKQLKEKNTKDIVDFSLDTNFDLSNKEHLDKIVNTIQEGSILFLNAGIAAFKSIENSNWDDINKILDINLKANMYLLTQLWDLIKTNKLKVIITLSTASYVNGAFESIYNTSKKALKEFIISYNTELEYFGSQNKIFMFVPHAIEGTKMTSGENKPSETLTKVIRELLEAIENNKNEYIPKYEEVYKRVFKEYIEDPIKQGIDSIEYKKSKGKLNV